LKKTSTRRHLVATALALALSAAAFPASAQNKPVANTTTTEGARQLYASAEGKFKASDFAGALVDFQGADATKPTPQTARYIGLCQDKLGHYVEAVAVYERFLSDVPSKLQKEADEIKARVAEIKAMPSHLRVNTTPPGAAVTIDGKPPPLSAPVEVDLPAGVHTLHATIEGHDAADQTVTLAFASKQDVALQLAEKAAPPPPVAVAPPAPAPPPAPLAAPPERRSKVPAIVTGALAVAAAGVGAAFGVITLNDKNTFNANPTESTAEAGQNHALISDMAFGVAITLGVTSLVLLLTNDEVDPAKTAREPAPATFALTPIVSPHGGGAGALLRF
jgi:hypothetical protein